MQGCKKLIYAFIFASILLLQGCVAHSQFLYNQAISYYSYQQYNRAFTLFAPLARGGDADAQYALAYLYYYGLGVGEDQGRADYWMNAAAAQGQPVAIQALKIIDSNRDKILKHPLQPVTIY